MRRVSRFLRLPCFLIVWMIVILSAHAGLKWESTTVQTHASEGQTAVTATFRFKNDGLENVEIESVHPSCGCTSATLKKTRISPGEAGVLAVTFTVGDRTGEQRKTISVKESDEKALTVLTLAVQLPESVKLSPQTLEWKSNEAVTTKLIHATTSPGVQLVGVEPSNPVFEAQNRQTTPGVWTITVIPKNSDGPLTALLRVSFEGKSTGALVVPLRIR